MAKKNNLIFKKMPPRQAGLPDLKIYIDEQGRIVKNYDVAELNDFLNKHVPDKKLEDK